MTYNISMNKYLNELKEKELSIIAIRGKERYESRESGINPIILRIEEDDLFFLDAIVYDKIIGKAAAMLLIRSGVKKVHALVMSKSAKKVLDEYEIKYTYEELVDKIINRKGNGICPMEKAVEKIDDLLEAYEVLITKV